MTHWLAVLIAATVYAALAWALGVMVVRVMGPLPDAVTNLLKKGWGEMVKTYFTVRYEEDDDGLWQIVEETATGDRYRVQVKDKDGKMKW